MVRSTWKDVLTIRNNNLKFMLERPELGKTSDCFSNVVPLRSQQVHVGVLDLLKLYEIMKDDRMIGYT